MSFHTAHFIDYPDILRWDYIEMLTGGGSNTSGCFVCYSTKDEYSCFNKILNLTDFLLTRGH